MGTLLIQYDILLQIAPTFYLGLFTTCVGAGSLVPGIVLGAAVGLFVEFKWKQLYGMDSGVVGMLFNILLVGILSLIFWIKKRKEDSENNEVQMLVNEKAKEALQLDDVTPTLDMNARHPAQKRGYWIFAVLCLFIAVPFYRKAGTSDPFIIGFPVWAFTSLCIMFVLCCIITACTMFLWKDSRVGPKENNLTS